MHLRSGPCAIVICQIPEGSFGWENINRCIIIYQKNQIPEAHAVIILKLLEKRLFHQRVMGPKDAVPMANSGDSDQEQSEPHHAKMCLCGFFDQVKFKPACSAMQAS